MTAAPRAPRWRRWILPVAGLVAVAALVAWALRPARVDVEVATATRGPMQVTLDEDGETRVRERFLVSAPAAGRVLRIELEPGDRVQAEETVVATIRPATPTLIDARTRRELQARVGVAEAALDGARAARTRVAAMVAQAERDLARASALVQAGAVSRERVEAADVALSTLRSDAQAAAERVRGAEADLRAARASLSSSQAPAADGAIDVRAPASGVVLRRLRESEAVVPQGEPLVEIADLARLEVVADYLSTDAVQIQPGQAALVERWGGGTPLRGQVRRVEPGGFTKVSALGVEEQRVNVVIALDPVPADVALGDRYRVEVRVVVWDAPAVTQVPIGSLVRDGEAWYVFVVSGDRAVKTMVTVGHRNDQIAEILDGVSPETTVIAFPGASIADGTRVRARPRS